MGRLDMRRTTSGVRVRGMVCMHGRDEGYGMAALTPSSSRRSKRWRGTMVTISISQRKAISGGVRPEGRGKAILRNWCGLVAMEKVGGSARHDV